MHRFTFLISFVFMLCFAGCEDSKLRLVTEAGVDAVKSITLTDKAVQDMAKASSAYADSQHRVAPPESDYATKIKRFRFLYTE